MRIVKLLHRWLGLLVGLQLLLWTVSGLMFAWLDHRSVAGDIVRRDPARRLLPADAPISDPSTWLHEYAGDTVRDIRLFSLDDQWVFRVALADRVELRRAGDGTPFAIDRQIAEAIARAHYEGDADIGVHVLPAQRSQEARDAGLVWRVNFTDPSHTALLVSASDGRLVAVRTRDWRVFDFFWMLHTMDYRERDDFNNPLAVLFATGSLWLAISGALLLTRSFGRAPRRGHS